MVILVVFPVALHNAETFMIPFSSISKVFSIYATPFGAGGIPSKEKFPKLLLSAVIILSPSKT